MVPGSTEIGPLPMMVKGKYIVGDLCSVLSENAWKELCVLHTTNGDGRFVLSNGRVLTIFKLPNGDGVYPDQNGLTYHVDSGTIGTTLVEGLEVEYGNIDNKREDFKTKLEMSGNIIDYKREFGCMSTSMVHPTVGPVSIIVLGEKVVINSDDELSGMGAFMYKGMAAAKEAASKEATSQAVVVPIGNV
jgi:hypothetical protein